jgi:hypothetical protein
MSQHIAVPNSEKFDATKGTLLRSVFSVAAVVGLLGAVVVYFATTDHALFAHVWLFAFMYFFTVLCGCFFWNCLHHATDSEWSVVIRRQVENLASLLKYIAIFFVPIALCVTILYAWMSAEPTKDAAMAGSKSLYLNKPFFWFRAVAFFALLGAISHILRKRSVAQDHDGAAKHTFSMRFWAILGIPTLAICLTFSGIDWMKALNHHWFSTMWGVYLFAGAAGASMALIVLVVSWLRKLGYLSVVNDEHYHLMGKFLLAFTVFWAYIGFSQYMLITYANLDEETIYFRVRNTGTWNYFSHLLVFGRFFFMFVPLLFQGLKKSKLINFTAVWILAMQFLDIFLIIIPELKPHGFSFSAALAAIFPWLAIGGCLGLLFLRHLGQGYLFPTKDPRLAGSLKASN